MELNNIKNEVIRLINEVKEYELKNGRNNITDNIFINIDITYEKLSKINNKKDLKIIKKDVNIIKDMIDELKG